jgi:predicted NBD/HSP70 family sugar kinase
VDIGGSNIRAGIVEVNPRKDPKLTKCKIQESERWRHAGEKPARYDAVEHLTAMLSVMIRHPKKEGRKLAPFIGIGCPGLIREDGSIEKRGQHLPGNWDHRGFKLPQLLRDAIPAIGGHEVAVLMHSDAVVQGLSEAPFMRDVDHWGAMTIGTGLGNARFTNRKPAQG